MIVSSFPTSEFSNYVSRVLLDFGHDGGLNKFIIIQLS